MKVERGRAAVWQHAEEADLQDVIRQVAAVFDLSDVAIITPGKLTYLNEKPRKYTRIRPFESDVKIDNATGEIIAR